MTQLSFPPPVCGGRVERNASGGVGSREGNSTGAIKKPGVYVDKRRNKDASALSPLPSCLLFIYSAGRANSSAEGLNQAFI